MSKPHVIKHFATFLLCLILATISTKAYADTNHTIQPGETIYSISRQYGVPVSDIISANQLANPSLIYSGQIIIIPTDDDASGGENTSQPTTETTTPTTTEATHVVQSGETMYSIARRYGVSVTSIAQANGLVNSNLIYVGQSLRIPGATGGTTTQPTTPAPTATPTTPTAPTTTNTAVHVVQSGETLSVIALRYNVTLAAIVQANGLSNANFIYVGQALTIPGASGAGSPVTSTSTLSGFAFGGQTQNFNSVGTMKDIGMSWVKFQYKWSPGDSPDAVTTFIEAGHNEGFKVLLSIPGKNTYPDDINFSAYTEFLRRVASLSNPPDAIEIWNEMNIDFEWPAGQISPTSYVNDMLAPAYNAIKGANSNILVISGAPAPTGFDNNTNAWSDDRYMRGVAAAGGGNYLDCIGIHYNAGATSPSTTSGHPGGSHYSWYYATMVNTYSQAFGGTKPLCFTEIGYLSGEGFSGVPTNFAWASGTSLDEHAQWLAEALRLSVNDGRVDMFIVFNVDLPLYQPDGDPQAGYALVRPDSSCPACGPLKAVTGN